MCNQIVKEISDKFLDLGLDEGHDSEQYEEMRMKQDRFKKEFEKLNFAFETQNLDMPKGSHNNEEYINEVDEDFEKERDMLG